jgi:hypothetical protein
MIQNGDENFDQMVEQLRLQVDEAAAILSMAGCRITPVLVFWT